MTDHRSAHHQLQSDKKMQLWFQTSTIPLPHLDTRGHATAVCDDHVLLEGHKAERKYRRSQIHRVAGYSVSGLDSLKTESLNRGGDFRPVKLLCLSSEKDSKEIRLKRWNPVLHQLRLYSTLSTWLSPPRKRSDELYLSRSANPILSLEKWKLTTAFTRLVYI